MKKDFLLIKLLMKFKGVFKNASVNFDDLVTILSLKLTLDNRKASAMGAGKKQKLTGMKANLLMQGFFGFFIGMIMFVPFDLFYKISIITAMDLFFMVLFMISDFSSVLLDTRDKDIILTKPVGLETMNASRLIHVIYYMISLFLALNVISIVILTIQFGPMIVLGFAIMLVLLSLFIVFVTTILYSILLERFSGEKLKDIINVFQIALSVITMISYQLVGRIFEFVNFELVIHIKWWTYLLPPAWYASMFKVLVEGDFTRAYLIMAALSIVVPVAAGSALIKWILPRYESYLSKLQIEDGVFVPKNSLKEKFKTFIYNLIASDHKERAFIKFADANLSRDRKLKLMILPNQALGYVFPLIMILPFLGRSGGIEGALAGMNGSLMYLNAYWALVMFISNFEFLQYSEKFEASFIYDSFPIEDKRVIFSGAIKAYYIKYMLPGMLLINVFFLILCGWTSLVGLLIIDVMSFFMLLLRYKMTALELPFSKEISSAGNKNPAPVFGLMGLCALIAGAQFLFVKNNILIGLLVLVVMIIMTQLAYVTFFKRPVKCDSN
ncbi:hypothetical protein [Fusibacter sp. 3D3]|uniref:hypothetical protein n=1 Tax=Fusibacter sp. 3D3 TaxID=1048380 RepID=UPI000852AC1F|nr:hypothetical protein [Fusibacter sp. 3D3]GAU78124.1 conserved protein [Fusibacter sp. 3D3]